VDCTVDTCLADGTCSHVPDDGRCSGGMTCDAQQGCIGGGCADDTFEQNDTRGEASSISTGSYPDLKICAGDEDWYRVSGLSGAFTVSIHFTNASGDLDLAVSDAQGGSLGESQGVGDSETVQSSASGDIYIRVYGYSGAENSYSLSVN
ncbi:MAG: PPC domain-containing protein, partial [Deltaproteobacteria bacterium]|nr:PPC domain-containing protein [Deltaproteobacteria bacterium]